MSVLFGGDVARRVFGEQFGEKHGEQHEPWLWGKDFESAHRKHDETRRLLHHGSLLKRDEFGCETSQFDTSVSETSPTVCET